MKYSQLISLSLFIFCGILLLCTVFMTDPSLVDGFVTGKIHWFHQTMLFFSVCSLVIAILVKPAKLFTFSVSDMLVLFWVAIIALTYNWQLNPEPEMILFGGQLVILWFLLRFMFAGWPQLRLVFLTIIILTGLLEALLGICQLYGFEKSNHSLFNLTGDFYNPGPYSGYLAMILPLCLSIILTFDKCLYYLAWICLLAIIVVLPAGMSRAAWIAAVVSCGWVYWIQRFGWKKTKRIINKNRTLSIISSIILLVLLACSSVGIYQLKKDSANGRLLLWKMTGQALLEHPYTGTGLGGFRVAYAKAQADYFASGKASKTEMMVAECPDYGFNEFLQIGLEQGIAGLTLFVLLLGYSLFQGLKNKQIGATGGILALIIFCMASYPLQLPEFWVVLVVLIAISNTDIVIDIPHPSSLKRKKILSVVMIGGLALCYGWIFRQQKNYYEGYKKWHTLKILHNNKMYEASSKGYKELTLVLKHRPELLFETALCFNRTEQYAEANKLLYQAMKSSNDPMIYYVTAKNEQLMGNYLKAENLLLYAINMLPERIYPYYLLTKLYSAPTFFQEDKFINAANAVLSKEPKVDNSAVREMREEVKILINQFNAK